MIPLWRRTAVRAEAWSRGERALAPAAAMPGDLRELLGHARARLKALTSDKLIWIASFTALGTAEVAMLSVRPGRFLEVLRTLGLAGASGLVVTAGRDLRAARAVGAKLDAANDLAWGLQGLAGLSFPAWAKAQALSVGLGVAGAALQTGAGLLRIGQGIRRRDGASIKLGALDLSGGLLWLGWDLIGLQQPLYVGSYVVLMIGREAYANRAEVGGIMDRLRYQARLLGTEAQAFIGEAYDDLVAARRASAEVLRARCASHHDQFAPTHRRKKT